MPFLLSSLHARITARATTIRPVVVHAYSRFTSTLSKEPYWTHIPSWKDVPPALFKDHQWQLFNSISRQSRLERFLEEVVPDHITPSSNATHIKTKRDFIQDASGGLKNAPMNIRITPHLLSLIDWNNPLDDPIRRQFLPSAAGTLRDHPQLTLDSLHEEADSPISGLVHRYPGRALFLVTSICPVYCRFCTRSYAIGGDTSTVKKRPQKPSRKRWEEILSYIETREDLHDIVVSGGDCFYLPPEALRFLGERLLDIPHIRRFRIASKGLAVSPGRLQPTDPWTNELIALSNKGRQMGKQVCLHTHFNHPREITWITKESADYLFANGVIVRNQSVLLRGINDDTNTMTHLIDNLSRLNIQPYYVYQCDLVRGIEDLRTPLSTILKLEKEIRGNISGFMMPSFVVDLPGGGGKRLASTYDSYSEETGISTWSTPGLPGEKGKQKYVYHDPNPVPIKAEEEVAIQYQDVKSTAARSIQLPRKPFGDSNRQPVWPELPVIATPRSEIFSNKSSPNNNRVSGIIVPLGHQEGAPRASAGAS